MDDGHVPVQSPPENRHPGGKTMKKLEIHISVPSFAAGVFVAVLIGWQALPVRADFETYDGPIFGMFTPQPVSLPETLSAPSIRDSGQSSAAGSR